VRHRPYFQLNEYNKWHWHLNENLNVIKDYIA